MSEKTVRAKCPYEAIGKQEDGLTKYRCPWCGHERASSFPAGKLRRYCPESPDLKQSAERLGVSLDDARHYVQALARWAKAGFPKRTSADIYRIYTEHCASCEHNKEDRCDLCGCRVKKSGLALTNKIAMQTESCPGGKW